MPKKCQKICMKIVKMFNLFEQEQVKLPDIVNPFRSSFSISWSFSDTVSSRLVKDLESSFLKQTKNVISSMCLCKRRSSKNLQLSHRLTVSSLGSNSGV